MDSHLLDLSDQLLTGARDVSDHHPLNMASPARLEELGPGLAFVESFCNVIAVETAVSYTHLTLPTSDLV